MTLKHWDSNHGGEEEEVGGSAGNREGVGWSLRLDRGEEAASVNRCHVQKKESVSKK